MTSTEQNKWEEKYNVATQRADFFELNTLVIPINSAILLTRMLLTEAIAQAIAEDRERVVGECCIACKEMLSLKNEYK